MKRFAYFCTSEVLVLGIQKLLFLIFLLLFHAVTLLASSAVVCAAFCDASCVVLDLAWGGVGSQFGSSSPVSSSPHFEDPPFVDIGVDCLFFEDVLNEITIFSVLRRPVVRAFGNILS